LSTLSKVAGGLGELGREVGRIGWDRLGPKDETVPASADAVTPEVLARALDLPSGSIRATRVVFHDRGTSDRARVEVDADERAGLPPTLFLKMTPGTFVVRLWSNLSRLAQKEIHFYRDAAPSIAPFVPHAYAALWDPRRGHSLIVLEDLAARGCTFPDTSKPCSPDQAHEVALVLGQIHREFLGSPRFKGDLAWFAHQRSPWTYMEGRLVRNCVRRLPGRLNALIPDDVRRSSQVLVERPGALHALLRRLPRTLIHNDSHPGNMYFDGPTPGIFDWQNVSYGPTIHDIGYFMMFGLEIEDRRKHERDILKTYLESLRGSGDEAIEWNTAWEGYQLVVATGYTSAVYTASFGSRLQREEIVTPSLQRAVAAVRDLETFEVLTRLAG
jgi:thiamine kinase-like enzyme